MSKRHPNTWTVSLIKISDLTYPKTDLFPAPKHFNFYPDLAFSVNGTLSHPPSEKTGTSPSSQSTHPNLVLKPSTLLILISKVYVYIFLTTSPLHTIITS